VCRGLPIGPVLSWSKHGVACCVGLRQAKVAWTTGLARGARQATAGATRRV